MLIGKEGALSQQQAEKLKTDEQEIARIKTLSNKNLSGEVKRAMRLNPTNLLAQALGTVLLVDFNEGKDRRRSRYDFGQDWYCRRTGPNRPKVGRQKKKNELKKSTGGKS